ncbi:MAG TPA: hypothetical protein VNU93_02105 [Verrucomicrobiae bacterium]|nr:hypothetical protein [Verrucomicrobiae bacterium]
MHTPAELWVATQAKARDEPGKKPFRLYFGLAYLIAGLTIYMSTFK